MKKIESILKKRAKVAEYYNKILDFVETPVVKEYVSNMSWFIYVIKLPKYSNRDKIIKFLAEKSIETRDYFAPVHLQPLYKKLGWKEGMLPVTEEISKRTLALPFYTDLKPEQQDYIAFYLKKALELFTS